MTSWCCRRGDSPAKAAPIQRDPASLTVGLQTLPLVAILGSLILQPPRGALIPNRWRQWTEFKAKKADQSIDTLSRLLRGSERKPASPRYPSSSPKTDARSKVFMKLA